MTTINTFLLLKPDWQDHPRVQREWRTAVQKAITGHEKRWALYSWARTGIQYTLAALGWEDMAYTRRKVFKFQKGIVGVPIWPALAVLTAQAASGQKQVQIASTLHFYTPGRTVALMDPANLDTYESGVIQSVTDTTITLQDNLDNTWDAGDEVAPVIPARIGDRQSFQWVTDQDNTARIVAREAFNG